jgi:hypothetical protein
MKTLVFALCFFASSAALAQVGAGVLSNEPVPISFTSHQARASQPGMSDRQDVMERSAPLIAQGERPLSDVASSKAAPVPLGDIARMLRKEQLTAKKATTVWEN